MKIEEFKKLTEKIVFLDGATGSNLVKAGMKIGECPEKWIIDNPEAIISLQKRYIEAGSDIVYAPTFTSNRIKLKEYGFENDVMEINKELVRLSRLAVKESEGIKKAYVAGDLTMTGVQLKPTGPMDFEELVDVYKEQIKALDEAGADLLVVETMMSLQETRAALIAAKEVSDLPVMCTLTFEEDGKTLFGTDALSAAITLESLGACAIGANCSTGPSKMVSIIKDMASVTNIPIIAKPNAGMPRLDEDGNTVYDLPPEEFAEEMKDLVDAGATILGGCCGTAPEYIKAIHDVFASKECIKRDNHTGVRRLSSERKSISFALNDPFIVVGERINPTGKKALQAELKEGNLDMVRTFAEEQEEGGAAILDINVGMGGIDEESMMLKVLEEVGMITSLPLSIDTSPVNVLEKALRLYPGRALVNSISAESAVMEAKLKVAHKYGAMIIALPLSDEGLPKNLDEKIENLNKILNKAYEIGFTKEDIVVDGLVSTVGANKSAALEVIETVRYAYKNGLATTCGLSNISFGLPQRPFVNTAFLTMLIENGLTMAIMNPAQDLLMNAVYATDLLMNKEGADLKYIERMNERDFSVSVKSNTSTASSANLGTSDNNSKNLTSKDSTSKDSTSKDELYLDVLKGRTDRIVEHTERAIKDGSEPSIILNNSLLPALDEVGKLFNSGRYYLPQLIASANAMKSSIEILEPMMLSDSKAEDMPTIVVATVKGDIHDIGKNLVTLMLKNHGFKVIDLGKDIPKEDIVKAAMDNDAKIIGLSALMTTTMKEMKNVIDYARSLGCKAKFMIGGAVITEDFAKEIGADGYSKDAQQAVEVAKLLVK